MAFCGLPGWAEGERFAPSGAFEWRLLSAETNRRGTGTLKKFGTLKK
jgi:hypothetical protein